MSMGASTSRQASRRDKRASLLVLAQQLLALGPRYLVDVRQHPVEVAELLEQLGRGLLPDPGDAGDVVGGVALQTDQVGDEPRRHSEPLLHSSRVVDLDLGDPAGVGHDLDVPAGQLERVAIAGDDERLPPLRFGLSGERGEDVVGLEARHRQVDEAERLGELGQVRPLLRKQIGHRLALRLVVLELPVSERLLPGIPGHDHRPRAILRQDLDDHGAETVQSVRGQPVGGGYLLGQREEGPVGHVVAVEQEERSPLGRRD